MRELQKSTACSSQLVERGDCVRQTGFSFIKDYKKEFGGSRLEGRRKSRRPLSTRHPIHVVLKSTKHKVLHPSNGQLKQLLHRECERFQIRVYDFAINWSHIHILIKIPHREAYVSFVRSFCAQVIRLLSMGGANKLIGLFDLRPYTKIITWGRQFKNAYDYQKLNQLESYGLICRKEQTRIKREGSAKNSNKRGFKNRWLLH